MTEVVLDVWETPAKVIQKALGLETVGSGVRRVLPVTFISMRYGRVQVKIELEIEKS